MSGTPLWFDYATGIATVLAVGVAVAAYVSAKGAEERNTRMLAEERQRVFELGILVEVDDLVVAPYPMRDAVTAERAKARIRALKPEELLIVRHELSMESTEAIRTRYAEVVEGKEDEGARASALKTAMQQEIDEALADRLDPPATNPWPWWIPWMHRTRSS